MAAGVLRQVVTAHETPVTHRAHKLLLPRVSSAVARQFIGTRKFFIAAIPAAAERLLPCVSAKMGLEMGAFEVGLSAAWEAAHVVSPSGEVYLRGTVLAGGNEQWSRGKGQQLGVPNSHDTGWAGGRLG